VGDHLIRRGHVRLWTGRLFTRKKERKKAKLEEVRYLRTPLRRLPRRGEYTQRNRAPSGSEVTGTCSSPPRRGLSNDAAIPTRSDSLNIAHCQKRIAKKGEKEWGDCPYRAPDGSRKTEKGAPLDRRKASGVGEGELSRSGDPFPRLKTCFSAEMPLPKSTYLRTKEGDPE